MGGERGHLQVGRKGHLFWVTAKAESLAPHTSYFSPIWGKGILRKLLQKVTAWTSPNFWSNRDIVLSMHSHESPGKALRLSPSTQQLGVPRGLYLGQWCINRSSSLGFSGKLLRNGADNCDLLFLSFPKCSIHPGIWISRLELQHPFWRSNTVQHVQNDFCSRYLLQHYLWYQMIITDLGTCQEGTS